ncbi:MAG: hypothetical protein FWF00_01150 [Endomicrobia bacterium]|nr:hypothetical protein [Endomicrobiia bacterium]MCL2506281.1 hypothetical protein [Endomicrobiia bacterium]
MNKKDIQREVNIIEQSNDYKRYNIRLIKLFYDYATQYRFRAKEYFDGDSFKYNNEVIDAVNNSIETFLPEEGKLFDYIKKSVENNINRMHGKETTAKARGGMSVSRSNQKLIRAIIAFSKTRQDDESEAKSPQTLNEKEIEEVAGYLKISVRKVKELIRMNNPVASLNYKQEFQDGDEAEYGDDAEDKSIDIDSDSEFIFLIQEKIKQIAGIYDKSQERTKQYDSALFTGACLKFLNKCRFDDKTICNLLENENFIDRDIFNNFKTNHKVPYIVETAKRFGRCFTDASRRLRETGVSNVLKSKN